MPTLIELQNTFAWLVLVIGLTAALVGLFAVVDRLVDWLSARDAQAESEARRRQLQAVVMSGRERR